MGSDPGNQMNDRRRMEFRVGLLALAAIAVVVGFVALLGDFSFGPTNTIYVDFDNTGGLQKGAPVMMSGVEIGRIGDINLIGPEAPGPAAGTDSDSRKLGVRVTAEIDRTSFASVPMNVTASIAARSVLGEKHLELTPQSPPGRPMPEGTLLDGRPPVRLEKAGDDAMALFRQLSKFMTDNSDKLSRTIDGIHELTLSANDFLKTNRPKLESAIDNLETASRKLAEEVSDKGRAGRMMGRADGIVARLDTATREIDRDLPALVKSLDSLSTKADKLLTDLGVMTVKVGVPASEAMSDLRDIASGANSGRGSVGKLLKDDELYNEAMAFIKDIKAHPWKLLFRK